jgi:hypothetical protein
VWRSGRVEDCGCEDAGLSPGGVAFEKFKLCRRSSTFVNNKFDIYSKIFFRDVGNFFRHLCELVLRHQMRVSNYFVNSFYSAESEIKQGAYHVSIRDEAEVNRRNRQNGTPVLKKRLNLIHGTLNVFGQTL